MDRSAFLERLRSRAPAGAPANVAHPLVDVDAVPHVRYEQDLDDLVAAFTRNATMQGARVEAVADAHAFVRGVIAELEAKRVVVSGDDETKMLTGALDDVEVLAFDRPRPEADLGIVGAAYGIAATGTVVFDAGRARGRTASLLPPAIVVLLEADSIVRDAGEIFRRVDERFPSGLPSQLVLCTGPSKSGDIELELTTGVHGPGRVWIGLT